MRGRAETRPGFLRKQPNGCYLYSNARPESARMPPRSWRVNGCAVLRCGPPGAQPGPLRLSTSVGLAFTTGPPPVLAAPGARGRVQGRSCCAGAAGMRAAASRPGPGPGQRGRRALAARCGRRGPWCRRWVRRLASPSHNPLLGYPFNRSKLRGWVTLVLARTIRSPWASSRPGSGPMRTA